MDVDSNYHCQSWLRTSWRVTLIILLVCRLINYEDSSGSEPGYFLLPADLSQQGCSLLLHLNVSCGPLSYTLMLRLQ